MKGPTVKCNMMPKIHWSPIYKGDQLSNHISCIEKLSISLFRSWLSPLTVVRAGSWMYNECEEEMRCVIFYIISFFLLFCCLWFVTTYKSAKKREGALWGEFSFSYGSHLSKPVWN